MTPALVSDLFCEVERYERRVTHVTVPRADFPVYESAAGGVGRVLWGAELSAHDEWTVFLISVPSRGGPSETTTWILDGSTWKSEPRPNTRYDRSVV